MVSLKDIAAACGVSTATVSKALRNQKDIGEATKARIRETADRMGYYPNAAARALKTNESKNLGVLYQEDAGKGLTHEYFSGVLQGFKSQAELLGYDITFISTHRGAEGRSYLEHCRYRNFAGVVVVCATYTEPEVMELMTSDFPVVTIDYVYQDRTAVSSNNVQGMNLLLDYVISMGHRSIAYIHGQLSSPVSKERVAVFYRAMEAHGIQVPEEYVIESHFLEPEEAGAATKQLLELSEPPGCILYPDDFALVGGLGVIRSRGLGVPDDISIAGYDGVRFSQIMYPKLTTIQQDTDRIGREAASRLVGMIEKPKTSLVERVVVEGILLKGESVGRV